MVNSTETESLFIETKEYHTIPYNRTLFEKLIVVKMMIIFSHSLKSEGSLPL
jgi:hypothetical protein